MSVLEAYRRTGADPPFGDPRRAHGVRFEGYYWRFTDAAAGRVVIVLCGVCRDAAGTWALVALAAQPGGLVRSAIVPVARADPRRARRRGRGRPARRADSLHVDLGPDARLDVALREPRPWPPRRAFGALGPAQLVPGLPQYWHPHLLGARVEGEARLGEETVDLSGATAYAEKNWGPAFTEHWWWGQAQGFPDADACVAFAGGRIALAGVRAAPTAVVVRVEDRVLRLAPPLARMTAAIGGGGWRIRGALGALGGGDRGRGGGRAGGAAGARAGAARGRAPLAPPPGRAWRRAAGRRTCSRGSRGWRWSVGCDAAG